MMSEQAIPCFPRGLFLLMGGEVDGTRLSLAERWPEQREVRNVDVPLPSSLAHPLLVCGGFLSN